MNATASIYEKLGVFYLGREFDLQQRQCRNTPVLYDSRDLLTHAVIMGMTGSGKTGLGISLLEEAAIDSIPALIIDPKGDLGNLLLTFPELGPADFAPWVHAEDAQCAGLSVDEFAARQATNWREGLAQWDQAGERIARLREAAEFQIYTPGSEAGQARLDPRIVRGAAARHHAGHRPAARLHRHHHLQSARLAGPDRRPAAFP